MQTTDRGAARASAFEFPYITCRNISGPEDEAAGRKVYAGHAPASSVLELEDDENVREYLVDAFGKAKARPTLVHQAIRKTLGDHPDQFSILNGGMVIVARAADVDDKRRVLTLKRPSIINGSQTQGELRRYFERTRQQEDFYEPSIKFELIVTTDDDLIAEVSISRNFQNDVRPISIAGRRGQLDELEEAVQHVIPGAKLRKSETDLVVDDGFLDTEKLIQVLFALMPQKLLTLMDKDATSKAFAYSQKTRCLKLFQRVVEGHEDIQKAARSRYGSETELRVELNPNTGKLRLTRLLLVVAQVENDAREIALDEAKTRNPASEVGDYIAEALPPLEYGRNEDLEAIYSYFLDMAGSAWKLYEKWKTHPQFRGTRLRSIERDNGEVVGVPDGIVFPILSAMSAFVTPSVQRQWELRPVERFDEQELIDAAAQVYMEIADHNPQTMGKNKACYSALQRITAIYARLAAA
jgi:AIPR protein/NusA N-terminal domain